MYDSHELYGSPYSLVNYGETRPIVGLRKSLETMHGGRLTYIQDNKSIREAYIDESGMVQKDTIMLIDNRGTTLDDTYIFDKVAAVKPKNLFFVFFARPLTLNAYASTLTVET